MEHQRRVQNRVDLHDAAGPVENFLSQHVGVAGAEGVDSSSLLQRVRHGGHGPGNGICLGFQHLIQQRMDLSEIALCHVHFQFLLSSFRISAASMAAPYSGGASGTQICTLGKCRTLPVMPIFGCSMFCRSTLA